MNPNATGITRGIDALKPGLICNTLVAALLFLLQASSAPAATWYISPTGNDSNSGTSTNAPLATLPAAQTLASSGDTVYIMAGTYYPTTTYPVELGVYVPVILINKNGITYKAMPGTRPVFNFSLVNPTGERVAAFWVTASNVTFQGFDVVAVQENITTSNNPVSYTHLDVYKRQPYTHDPRIGRVRRLYVLQAYRRSGVGRALLEAVVAYARDYFRLLRVRTEEAGEFYTTHGFRCIASEAETTHVLELTRAA